MIFPDRRRAYRRRQGLPRFRRRRPPAVSSRSLPAPPSRGMTNAPPVPPHRHVEALATGRGPHGNQCGRGRHGRPGCGKRRGGRLVEPRGIEPRPRIANATLSHLSYGPAPARARPRPRTRRDCTDFAPRAQGRFQRAPRFGQVFSPSLLTSGARLHIERSAAVPHLAPRR